MSLYPKMGGDIFARAVSEKKTFKNCTIFCTYLAQGQGQITHRDKILIVTKKLYSFIIHCK